MPASPCRLPIKRLQESGVYLIKLPGCFDHCFHLVFVRSVSYIDKATIIIFTIISSPRKVLVAPLEICCAYQSRNLAWLTDRESRTPKSPRKFQNAHPISFSVNTPSISLSHAINTSWGVSRLERLISAAPSPAFFRNERRLKYLICFSIKN